MVATYNLIYNATFLVERGIGYALCLARLVNTKGRNLAFRPIVPGAFGRPVHGHQKVPDVLPGGEILPGPPAGGRGGAEKQFGSRERSEAASRLALPGP